MDTHTETPNVYRFLAPVALDPATQDTALPAANRRFSGLAYSGGLLTDNVYGNPIAIDLSTLSVETPLPLLEGHDHDDTIGVVDTAETGSGLSIAGTLFSAIDEDAAAIAAKADAGFPWQMSVGSFPGSIEEVQAGQTSNVNGQTFTGPLWIFRNTRIREISFCALGADPKTTARVFNAPTPRTPMTTEIQNAADVAALQAKLDQAEAALAVELAGRIAAETKLAEFAAAQRKDAVAKLFAELGREPEDAAMQPYLAMDEAMFSAVAADLAKLKPSAPAGYLFGSVATQGGQPASPSAEETSLALLAQLSKQKA